MKAQGKTFLPVVLFLCLLVFGFFPSTAFGQDNLWTINKTANVVNLILSPGQQYQVNYTLTVDLQDHTRLPEPPYMALNVSDLTYDIFLGTVDLTGVLLPYGPDVFPRYFYYSHLVGPYSVCGDYIVENVGKICNGTTSTCTVFVHVPCPGCTLTPGYWKTHSALGPAPYDDTWALLPGGLAQNTIFFLSSKTWHDVLWTPPVKGDAYYILVHAYIAAYLNKLNGAGFPAEVDAALTEAEAFFNSTAPTTHLSKALRQELISYATILDNFNKGLIGPGHCSEEGIN